MTSRHVGLRQELVPQEGWARGSHAGCLAPKVGCGTRPDPIPHPLPCAGKTKNNAISLRRVFLHPGNCATTSCPHRTLAMPGDTLSCHSGEGRALRCCQTSHSAQDSPPHQERPSLAALESSPPSGVDGKAFPGAPWRLPITNGECEAQGGEGAQPASLGRPGWTQVGRSPPPRLGRGEPLGNWADGQGRRGRRAGGLFPAGRASLPPSPDRTSASLSRPPSRGSRLCL